MNYIFYNNTNNNRECEVNCLMNKQFWKSLKTILRGRFHWRMRQYIYITHSRLVLTVTHLIFLRIQFHSTYHLHGSHTVFQGSIYRFILVPIWRNDFCYSLVTCWFIKTLYLEFTGRMWMFHFSPFKHLWGEESMNWHRFSLIFHWSPWCKHNLKLQCSSSNAFYSLKV